MYLNYIYIYIYTHVCVCVCWMALLCMLIMIIIVYVLSSDYRSATLRTCDNKRNTRSDWGRLAKDWWPARSGESCSAYFSFQICIWEAFWREGQRTGALNLLEMSVVGFWSALFLMLIVSGFLNFTAVPRPFRCASRLTAWC